MALNDSNIALARQVLGQMAAGKSEPRVLYLYYKLGLLEGNDMFGTCCQTAYILINLTT